MKKKKGLQNIYPSPNVNDSDRNIYINMQNVCKQNTKMSLTKSIQVNA